MSEGSFMKGRPMLAISLFANVLLVTMLLVSSHRFRSESNRPFIGASPSSILATTGDTTGPAVATPRETAWPWASIQTRDAKALIGRLRAAGCPEATIRDIVMGELNRNYNPRIRALRKSSNRYWETQQRRDPATFEDDRDHERAAAQLEEEKARFIRDLLGITLEDYAQENSEHPDRYAGMVDTLAAGSRARAREVLKKYDQLERELVERANGTLGKPELDELRELYGRKQAEMKAFLSDAEMEEFELRASPLADELRNHDLVGFSPTEEEFRAIFRIKKEFEEGTDDHSRLTSNEPEKVAQARSSLEERLRTALGDKRYADYERSQDFAYRRLLEITDHFGLSNEPAGQVHEFRLGVFKEVNTLSEDPNLSLESRRAVLATLQRETRQNVAAALGDEAFAAYAQSPWGTWMDRIGEWTNGVVLRQWNDPRVR